MIGLTIIVLAAVAVWIFACKNDVKQILCFLLNIIFKIIDEIYYFIMFFISGGKDVKYEEEVEEKRREKEKLEKYLHDFKPSEYYINMHSCDFNILFRKNLIQYKKNEHEKIYYKNNLIKINDRVNCKYSTNELKYGTSDYDENWDINNCIWIKHKLRSVK